MPDNKQVRGGQDRERVNVNEPYEVRYLAEKLGVSQDEVKKAVAKVGDRRTDVEAHLRGERG